MKMELRKIVTTVEVTHTENDKELPKPMKTAVVSAVIKNPWAGQGYVEDLGPVIAEIAPQLAEAIVPELISAMGGASNIEAYGKAAVIGLGGEIEHASALIHTLRFGNLLRESAEGTSFLSFTNKRGAPGSLLTLPLVHKLDRSVRSHFLTVDSVVFDAPMADEIVVSVGAASSGRPFARIGDRHEDVAEGKVYRQTVTA
jgi:hypothetical protein